MGDPSVSKERYEVFCEGRVAVLDNWRTLLLTHRGRTDTHRALKADKGHAAELRAFFAACRGDRESPIPWSSIAATTRATFAAMQSLATGAAIDLEQ